MFNLIYFIMRNFKMIKKNRYPIKNMLKDRMSRCDQFRSQQSKNHHNIDLMHSFWCKIILLLCEIVYYFVWRNKKFVEFMLNGK